MIVWHHTSLLSEIIEKALGRVIENTAPFNYTGHPAITLNAGFVEGLPIGVMLVSKSFDEANLLNVAYGLEQALAK